MTFDNLANCRRANELATGGNKTLHLAPGGGKPIELLPLAVIADGWC